MASNDACAKYFCFWVARQKIAISLHGNASTESDATVPAPLFSDSEEQCVLVEGGGGLVVGNYLPRQGKQELGMKNLKNATIF